MGGRVKLTTEIFINRAKEVHDSLYDYSKVVYQKSNIKVCITDLEYGDFWITPNNHLRGRGHPTRGEIKSAKAQLLSKQEFIERAAAIHGGLYDYSKVEYLDTKTRVK